MTILAIETSCDETAVALIRPVASGTPQIIDERIFSQIALHAQYGGVVPELAAREHLRAVPQLVSEIVRANQSNLCTSPISLLAVTVGPGLKGSLLMGVNFSKGFSIAHNIAVTGVNHIEAHLLSPLMSDTNLKFPYLGVVVSGGHTEILDVRGVGDYRLVERTVDDAAGEAFDKCAALLGIAYPGGRALSRLADSFRRSTPQTNGSQTVDPYRVSASRAQLSYSGLKTSFRTALANLRKTSTAALDVERACCAVQEAIVHTLQARVRAACQTTGIQRIGLSGGVAANGALRSALASVGDVHACELKWCGDNAAMIGFTAALRQQRGFPSTSLETRARWPVELMTHITP